MKIPSKDALEELLEKVKASEGPSFHLEGELHAAFFPERAFINAGIVWNKLSPDHVGTVPNITADIGKAIAFTKAVLPEWHIHLHIPAANDQDPEHLVQLEIPDSLTIDPCDDGWIYGASLTSTCLALLLATLRALIALKEDGNEG